MRNTGVGSPNASRAIFITGIPGAGKSTLAGFLSKKLGRTLITMHEIVERIDPGALERGDMANEPRMRRAFVEVMDDHAEGEIIVDGWPRSMGQALLLPADAQVLMLGCREDIARDRLLRRGRRDDTPELVEKRIREQSALLAVDEKDSWSYQLAGWENTINTSYRTPASVCTSVYRYLIGEKKQAFDG